jgi:hypothetical protein
MKYFTKQLWGNCRESAIKQWYTNLRTYLKYIDRVSTQLGPTIYHFINKVPLHDGHIDSFSCIAKIVERKNGGYNRYKYVEICVIHPFKPYIYVLKYSKVRICVFDFPSRTPMSSPDAHFGSWGYDEFTLLSNGWIRHEILLDSGATILIECKRFSYTRKKSLYAIK